MRYLLPIYPFLFVWVSRLASIKIERRMIAARIVFYGLCFWYLLLSLSVYPDYLAYYNELVGGPNGFGYKVSADGDWGQDFKELKRYMDRHGLKEIKLLCFGAVDPGYYGIKYEDLTKEEYIKPISGKYYAVSTFFLRHLKWTDEYKPMAKIGNTIFIYHVRDDKNHAI
jgi:hypothetical protein